MSIYTITISPSTFFLFVNYPFKFSSAHWTSHLFLKPF